MKYLITISLLLIFNYLNAQLNHKIHYMQWIFGAGNDPNEVFGLNILDFNDGTVKLNELDNPNLYEIGRGGTIICDKQGKIDLLSNICNVVDNDMNELPGAFNITDNSIVQQEWCDLNAAYPISEGGSFFPMNDGYKFIYMDAHDENINNIRRISTKNYFYAELTEQNNSYTLSRKKVLLNGLFGRGNLKTTYHSNNKDIWVIVNPLDTDTLLSYLLVDDSLELKATSVLGPKLIKTEAGFYFSTVFSSNNDRLAMLSRVGAMTYEFDDSTGEFSNYRKYDIEQIALGGVGFSPNDRFLYVSNGDHIYQIDLESDIDDPDIHDYGSFFSVTEDNFPIGNGVFATGPDCRLYISPGASSYFMHVIHNPNEKGESANLTVNVPTPNIFYFAFPKIPNLFPNCDPDIVFDIRTSVLEPADELFPMVVFPNPASDKTTINIDPNSEGSLAVFDIQGQLVSSNYIRSGTLRHEIDVASWESGMYVLRYQSEKGVFTGKLFVE